MYFDDSFFEDSVADGCERREECNKRKIDYTAKRCEPEVGSTYTYVVSTLVNVQVTLIKAPNAVTSFFAL